MASLIQVQDALEDLVMGPWNRRLCKPARRISPAWVLCRGLTEGWWEQTGAVPPAPPPPPSCQNLPFQETPPLLHCPAALPLPSISATGSNCRGVNRSAQQVRDVRQLYAWILQVPERDLAMTFQEVRVVQPTLPLSGVGGARRC